MEASGEEVEVVVLPVQVPIQITADRVDLVEVEVEVEGRPHQDKMPDPGAEVDLGEVVEMPSVA